MLRPIALLLAAVILTACGPKGQQAGQGTADSTASASAFTDSAKVQDSIGPSPSAASSADSTAESTSAPGAVGLAGSSASQLRDSTVSKSASKAPRAEPYIGRDSAFGPTFTVDSTGKVTPIIPAKKKP